MPPAPRALAFVILLGGLAGLAGCQTPGEAGLPRPDWLIDPAPFVARVELSPDGRARELRLSNGLVSRTWRLEPDLACIALDDLTSGASLLRALEPEASLVLSGREVALGGLLGQPDRAYLLDAWLDALALDPAAFHCTGFQSGPIEARFPWQRKRPCEERPWPPPGMALRFDFRAPDSTPGLAGLHGSVHYELYDGLPLFSKWLELTNEGVSPIALERYESERLALVETVSSVEHRASWPSGPVLAFSDYAMHGGDLESSNQVIHWETDAAYTTQVSYQLATPCRLVSRLPLGPAEILDPGERFESHRTYELVLDSSERERCGLALRRALRTLAPWATENPLLLHARSSEPAAARAAIDQAAEVGFELVLLSFGSGFDPENEDPAYVASIRELVDHAHARGVELGGYSLLASRRISDQDDVLDPLTGEPGHAIFGNSPCLESAWGQEYFRKLRSFVERTGLDALEHDGSYPGDLCASSTHPGHAGLADSQWRQWRRITGFYRWCRARDLYLNVPDFYFLEGANKTAMGYRETNWSLPREEQLLHARANIFDGTWEKAPSMGWMFVPLVEYQGGGAAATLEPLREHLDTYRAFLELNLGAGVQACWRGPRLYDSEATRALAKKWVDFYKLHRAILESDIVHLRRADGRDWDGWLHVNPFAKEKGLAMIYNPLERGIEREIALPLYYTGLETEAHVREQERPTRVYLLDRERRVHVRLALAPRSATWFVIE